VRVVRRVAELRRDQLLELLGDVVLEQLRLLVDAIPRHPEALGEVQLEHHISEELEELIAAKLGHPTHDPHGDPIPTRELTIDEGESVSLASLEPGARGCFTRVSDQDPAMLRYLAERGIAPGDSFEVVDKQPFGGPLFVRFRDDEDAHVLGGELAAAMRVETTS
jgi:DtxR family Mn-dependent transcriptional regulator